MDNQDGYTAEDGLKILEYMGLTRITDAERGVFIDKWKEIYTAMRGSLVMTTWKLYSEVLPFLCGDGDSGSLRVSRIRDSEFGDRLKYTELSEDLRKGKSLADILQNRSHRFYNVVRAEQIASGDGDIFKA